MAIHAGFVLFLGTCFVGFAEPIDTGTTHQITVEESMKLAGQHLLASLDRDNQYYPYWEMHIDPDFKATYNSANVNHNLGRIWDALLKLEDVSDFRIPPDIEGGLIATTKTFFDNTDHLSIYPGQDSWELHSLRESLLALSGLAGYRQNSWAHVTGELFLNKVWEISTPECSWNFSNLEHFRRNTTTAGQYFMDPVGSCGRMIEALVQFYQVTGDKQALLLAERFATWHLNNAVNSDGTFRKAPSLHHNHSYLCMIRGLIMYGMLTGQTRYIEAVCNTYKVTIRNNDVKECGWTPHDIWTDGSPDPASAADSALIALLLADAGHEEFLDDVERIVRCRILPSQIVTLPQPLTPANPESKEDRFQDLSERIVGAYGGIHKEPHGGKQSTTDVTGHILSCMTDIYRNTVVDTPNGVKVNFHFNYEDEKIRVESTRNENAEITLRPKTSEDILFRIPQWTPEESVSIQIDRKPASWEREGGFARITQIMPDSEVIVVFGLPVRKTKETCANQEFEFTWRGDEIIGVFPNCDFLPFYPTAPDTGAEGQSAGM